MLQTDIGNWLRAVPVSASTAVVTKSSDDTTELTGRSIDRLILERMSTANVPNPANPPRMYLTAKVLIPWHGTFASSVGIKIVGRMLHATSTAAGDFAAFQSTGITRT